MWYGNEFIPGGFAGLILTYSLSAPYIVRV